MATRAERRGDQLRFRTSDGLDLPWPYEEDLLRDLGAEFPAAPEGRTAQLSGVGPLAPGSAPFRMDLDAEKQRADVERSKELQARQGMGGEGRTQRVDPLRGYSAVPKPQEEKTRELGREASELGDKKSKVSDAEADRLQAAHDARLKKEGITIEADRKPETGAPGQGLRGGAERENIALGPAGAGMSPGVGGGGRPRRIPGGLRLEGMQVQKGAKPELVAGLQDANERATASEKTAIGAEAQQELEMATVAAQEADDFIGAQKSRVDNLRAQRHEAEAQISREQAVRDHERAQLLEDEQAPRDFWAEKSTGTKILAAIGALMAGIGNRENPLKPITDAIQEDKAAHRARLASREKGVGYISDKIEALHQRLGTELSLEEIEARESIIAAATIRRFALKTGNPAIIARANAQADKIELAGREKSALVDKELNDRVVETIRNVPDQYVGGAAAIKPEARERLVTFGGGQHRGFVVAGNARERVQQAVTGWENIADLAGQMRAVAKDASAGNLDAQRKYNSLRSAYLAEVTVMRGQGAMSEGDQANAEQGAPDISKLSTTRNEAETRMREQENIANARLRSVVRDNVYADPDATTPVLRGSPRVQRGQE